MKYVTLTFILNIDGKDMRMSVNTTEHGAKALIELYSSDPRYTITHVDMRDYEV